MFLMKSYLLVNEMSVFNSLNLALQLIRFNKPIGTYLLLWPSLASLFLASPVLPEIELVLAFTLAVFLARSMGCIINDIADHKFDILVERTKDRPITTGKISRPIAWVLFILFGLGLFALSFYFNALVVKLAFIALFLMMIYPFSKRFFPIPQLFLGLAYGFGTIMAFAATNNSIEIKSFVIYIFVVIWALYYDTLYALVDLQDDKKLGIHTSAIYFGNKVFICLYLMVFAMVFFLILIGIIFNLNFYYFIGLVAVLYTFYQQHKLIKDKNKASYFKAFKDNNYTGLFWFIAVFLGT